MIHPAQEKYTTQTKQTHMIHTHLLCVQLFLEHIMMNKDGMLGTKIFVNELT